MAGRHACRLTARHQRGSQIQDAIIFIAIYAYRTGVIGLFYGCVLTSSVGQPATAGLASREKNQEEKCAAFARRMQCRSGPWRGLCRTFRSIALTSPSLLRAPSAASARTISRYRPSNCTDCCTGKALEQMHYECSKKASVENFLCGVSKNFQRLNG